MLNTVTTCCGLMVIFKPGLALVGFIPPHLLKGKLHRFFIGQSSSQQCRSSVINWRHLMFCLRFHATTCKITSSLLCSNWEDLRPHSTCCFLLKALAELRVRETAIQEKDELTKLLTKERDQALATLNRHGLMAVSYTHLTLPTILRV